MARKGAVKLKHRAHMIFKRAAVATSDQEWVQIAPGEFKMKKPYYFPDKAALEKFLNNLTPYEGAYVQIGEKSWHLKNNSIPEIVDQISNLPVPSLQSIVAYAQMHEFVTPFVFHFQQKNGSTKAKTIFRLKEGEHVSSAILALMNAASPLPRSRRKPRYPLLEPISADISSIRRHENDLKKSARWSGIWAGSLSSVMVAIASYFFPLFNAVPK